MIFFIYQCLFITITKDGLVWFEVYIHPTKIKQKINTRVRQDFSIKNIQFLPSVMPPTGGNRRAQRLDTTIRVRG